ncbi:MAG: HigA family addiction module antitoxin [Thermodesulfobacteriota bacterium]
MPVPDRVRDDGSGIQEPEYGKKIQLIGFLATATGFPTDLGVPPRRINEIVHGKRRITADTALRLAHYFRMSPQFWLGLQMDYDLEVEEDRLADRLTEEVKTYQAA